ncbi:MAG: pyruvate kinase [Clostridia bacterium]|nr:pyruvate kinase [Clostridia bacterium]MBQ7046676.1 pyruvate kinase [Oscillospiraceae bacterium]
MRKTKIVCTLGPATTNAETIEQMLKAGMNVARLNFSHGTHETHQQMIELFRSVRDKLEIPAAIMLDTKGPEIRLCDFEDGKADFKEGSEITLTTDRSIKGHDTLAAVTYDMLPSQLSEGNHILIDDGRITLEVLECLETQVRCKVTSGGTVSNHKGINIPGVHIDMPYLSEQDKSDLLFGIKNDVDFIAASFVRSKDDVVALRKFLDYNGGHYIKIISKIENIEGINNFDEILELSDGIMVARGDMGVEVEYERLPGIQKKAIRLCYQSGKVAITATQMLESMINSPTPTRAEISDVANAVFDGTSAVMLSGESAAGKYPVLAVQTMAKIAEQAEHDAFDMKAYSGIKHDIDYADTTNALCDAACTTARDLNVKAIIAVTKHGQTARRMSKFRPFEPIVAATPLKKTFHQLSLSWGVYPVLAKFQSTTDDLFIHAVDCAKQIDLVTNKDKVVIVAGIPLDTPGNTNILKVQTVGDIEVVY